MQKTGAECLDAQAECHIKQAGSHQAAHGAGNAPGIHPMDNRCDESKRRCQENGNHAFGNKLEYQGAGTGGEQGDIGIQTGEQGNQDQGAEGNKQHLGAHQAVFGAERVLGGGLVRGHNTSFGNLW